MVPCLGGDNLEISGGPRTAGGSMVEGLDY